MSRASEIAAELNADQESIERQMAWVQCSREIIVAQADDLWEMFAAYLVDGVQTIAEGVAIAKTAGLSTQRLGHTLIVSTKQLPVIRLTIVYTPKSRVAATLSEQFTAMSAPTETTVAPFRFTVEPKLGTCLTDGDRYLSPQLVGDEFLDRIRLFFKEAWKRPNILS